jgi:asparagine synthase (glutamine-hydrolysing)
MCGIGGFLQTEGLAPSMARADLEAMSAALTHRGPDGQGFWLDPSAGVAFCHRRLSIVDLSPLGAQPMRSASGRFTITFNGEIYNHRALREQLAALGHAFRGGSDTEVLLASIEEWGVEAAVPRCRGMFAFGLWDAAERILWLGRDRFGEKPLYYGQFRQGRGATFVFGSELKALRGHSAWSGEIDRNALALLLRHDFIPAPHTVFREVSKLAPGHFLRVRCSGSALRMEDIEYWRPSVVGSGDGRAQPTEAEALESVHAAIAESIRLQMVADVPVGAFLSGGIDSSLVVSLMQQASSKPVRTFSIGFEEDRFNEAHYARRVAAHLGTQHTEYVLTSRDALDVIPRLPGIYDEPFADSSQIPTYLVSSLARRDVTVSLSGDAGDELFGGYSRYLEVRDRWNYVRHAPLFARRLAARALETTPPWALDAVTAPLRLLARLRGRQQVADRILERANVWRANSLPELYGAMTSFWQPSSRVVIGAGGGGSDGDYPPGLEDPLAHMMYADTRSYLPDDILVKVDRAAMAVSLETRVPLLDPQVAAAAWRIPTSLHLKDGRGKWILRTLLARYVPRELFDRPKSGFAVPVGRWLRTELREWAQALLDPARLRREGYFRCDPVQRRWAQHLSGQMNWTEHLWAVLMFQAWLEDFSRGGARLTAAPTFRFAPAGQSFGPRTPAPSVLR